MKITLLTTRLLITVSCMTACGYTSPQKEKATEFPGFEKEIKLQIKPIYKIKDRQPDGLMLFKDSLLLVRNFSNGAKFHFSVFDLKTRTFQWDVVGSGRHPGRSMAFLSYGIFGNTLWVNDIIKEKVIQTDLESVVNGGTGTPMEIPIPIFYYGVQLLSATKLVGTGDYDSDYKIAEVDLSTGKVEKQSIPYAAAGQPKYSRPQKMAYESLLVSRPDGLKCVNAGRYSDRIEIFDIQHGTSKVIKGPEGYEPEIIVMKEHDGREIGARGSDTRYAFVKAKATGKYIYLLYSGNNHETSNLFYGKMIYVYDWEGKPVQKLELPAYILDFSVTSDDSRLYSYDPRSKNINISNLKL